MNSIDEARHYEEHRFQRRGRTRRLDRWEKRIAQRMFDLAGQESHIVDVPCGPGRFVPVFGGARKLTLADLSPHAVEVCRERTRGMPHVEVFESDVRSLPLEAASADLCFCMRLFHHFRDDDARRAALRELARVSKRYVVVSFYNARSLRFLRRRLLRRKIRGNYVSFAHLAALAREVGLEPMWRFPKVNLIEQQCVAVFTKR
jgi:ubiquinone/menaquinone biosynthesis C-methylase UbiE